MKIPGRLNLLIMATALAATSASLWIASHSESWLICIGAAAVFALANNTNYALLHEAVHRRFHASPMINENVGRVLAGMFPTSFALQRVFHLAHHANNRTEHERFDYYAPDENRLIKTVQWYAILTGLYWVALPGFAILYFLTADLIRWHHILTNRGAWFARQTSARAFLDTLQGFSVWRARLDIAVAALVQVALIYGLGVSVFGWVICYAAFALAWSSLQYTDHAFSDLDRHEGAWNLSVSGLTRRIFLNYHYHLVHHRDPSLPWTVLPEHVRASDPSPSFWSIYWQMWRGPRPLPVTENASGR